MIYSTILALIVAYFFTKELVHYWIDLARTRQVLIAIDRHKKYATAIEAAGIGVILGLFLTLVIYSPPYVDELLVALLFGALVGLADDIIRFPAWLKPTLTIPLGFYIATQIYIPGLGLPLWLYRILAFIGIVGATNAINMLAGYNGLEARTVMNILFAQALYLFLTNPPLGTVPALAFLATYAFYRYNRFPSKAFPGDVFTYGMGAFIGAIAILYHIEILSALLFIPHFIDLALYLRARKDGIKDPQAFARVSPDGTLDLPYEKCYDTTHLAIKLLKKLGKRPTEPDVVNLITIPHFIYSVILATLFALL